MKGQSWSDLMISSTEGGGGSGVSWGRGALTETEKEEGEPLTDCCHTLWRPDRYVLRLCRFEMISMNFMILFFCTSCCNLLAYKCHLWERLRRLKRHMGSVIMIFHYYYIAKYHFY